MAEAPSLLAYVPGRSWLHRASPLPKLAWVAAGVVVVLLTYELSVLAVIGMLGFALAVSAGVARTVWRTVVALAPIGASIVVLQTLAPVACATGCIAAGTIGPLTLYQEGLSHALTLVARLVAMETVAVVALATTHPSDLFATLRSLRVPYQVALMAMLSMQLVPQLHQELRDVLRAQRARGLRASGIAALGPTLVPVVAGAFDRLTTLVLGLEARGLGAGVRTSYRQVSLRPVDRLATVLAVPAAGLGVVAAVTRWGADPAGSFIVPSAVAVGIVVAAAAIFVVVMGAGLRALVRT